MQHTGGRSQGGRASGRHGRDRGGMPARAEGGIWLPESTSAHKMVCPGNGTGPPPHTPSARVPARDRAPHTYVRRRVDRPPPRGMRLLPPLTRPWHLRKTTRQSRKVAARRGARQAGAHVDTHRNVGVVDRGRAAVAGSLAGSLAGSHPSRRRTQKPRPAPIHGCVLRRRSPARTCSRRSPARSCRSLLGFWEAYPPQHRKLLDAVQSFYKGHLNIEVSKNMAVFSSFFLRSWRPEQSWGRCRQRTGRLRPRQQFFELAGRHVYWKQADLCLPPGAARRLVVKVERHLKAINHHPVRSKARRLPRTSPTKTGRRPSITP